MDNGFKISTLMTKDWSRVSDWNGSDTSTSEMFQMGYKALIFSQGPGDAIMTIS